MFGLIVFSQKMLIYFFPCVLAIAILENAKDGLCERAAIPIGVDVWYSVSFYSNALDVCVRKSYDRRLP